MINSSLDRDKYKFFLYGSILITAILSLLIRPSPNNDFMNKVIYPEALKVEVLELGASVEELLFKIEKMNDFNYFLIDKDDKNKKELRKDLDFIKSESKKREIDISYVECLKRAEELLDKEYRMKSIVVRARVCFVFFAVSMVLINP